MQEILQLIEGYGLPLVLLLCSLYALYKFFVFSLYEVKNEFSKRHENNAKDMQYIKSKIDTILEFIKSKK
jgi:beta-lactamase regulating signal transducer with metallopeptidase domain